MLGLHLPYYCELSLHSALRNMVIVEKIVTNVKQGASWSDLKRCDLLITDIAFCHMQV